MKYRSLEELLYTISSYFVNTKVSGIDDAIFRSVAVLGGFYGHKAYFYYYGSGSIRQSYEWQKVCMTHSCQNTRNRYPSLFEDKIKNNKPVTTADLLALDDNLKTEYEHECIKSLLLLPVFHGKELFGIMGFENFEKDRIFNETEIMMLESFGQLLISVCQRKFKEEELARKTEELDNFFSVSLDLLCITDLEGRFVRLNAEWEQTLGYHADSLLNTELFQFLHPDDLIPTEKEFEKLKRGQPVLNFVNRYRTKNGGFRYLEWRANAKNNYIYASARDITGHLETERALALEKEHFRTILFSVGDGVIAADSEGKVVVLNTAAEQLTGWTDEEARGAHINEVFVIYDEFTKTQYENPFLTVPGFGEAQKTGSIVLRSKYGIERPIDQTVSAVKDGAGNISGAVIVFRDYTEKKEKQDRIVYLSYNDQLTGLYNRRFFEEAIIKEDTPQNLPISIAMLDVNGLKLTNDAFGHSAGDKLLITVSDIIRKNCRKEDIVSRIGGDEFVIIAANTPSEEMGKILKNIYGEIQKTTLNGINMSVSYGIETKTDSDKSLSDILTKAENYMYSLKLSESQSMRFNTVNIILKTIYEKSPREEKHSKTVGDYCAVIGKAAGLSGEEIHDLKIAGFMHDIGIIVLPDRVLNKAEPLTDEEWKLIHRHPETGYNILSSVHEFANLAKIVLQHHERIDGTGYPKNLKGEEIDLKARIIAVADAYEAMTNERPYRKTKTPKQAARELLAGAGTQFDAQIVDVFIKKVLKFKAGF